MWSCQIVPLARLLRMKAIPTERAIREWMTVHAGEFLYPESAGLMRYEVDATGLYEAWLAFVGVHDRPPNDEDHPAWWIAVEVAVAWEDAR